MSRPFPLLNSWPIGRISRKLIVHREHRPTLGATRVRFLEHQRERSKGVREIIAAKPVEVDDQKPPPAIEPVLQPTAGSPDWREGVGGVKGAEPG